jgi:hypothetical protein
MASSFEKIDYRLRPAKGVERRMMAEAFLRLRSFGSVESYRYVGMGSVYFSDFALFHSICGFETMISIEEEGDPIKQERFRFNVPLGTIALYFGNSNAVLPKLPWDLRSVVWLDYDGIFERSVLTDVRHLADKISAGSIICVSVNSSLGGEVDDEEAASNSRLDVLTGRIGADKIPFEVCSANLIKPSDIFKIYRTILTQELKDGLSARNAGRPAGQKFTHEQILFFRYKDGAPMLTIAWIIFEEGQRPTFDHCAFGTLPFYSSGDIPFVISPPLLTSPEIREIDRCNDAGTFRLLSDLPFPATQVERYQTLRRYWPLQTYPRASN